MRQEEEGKEAADTLPSLKVRSPLMGLAVVREKTQGLRTHHRSTECHLHYSLIVGL